MFLKKNSKRQHIIPAFQDLREVAQNNAVEKYEKAQNNAKKFHTFYQNGNSSMDERLKKLCENFNKRRQDTKNPQSHKRSSIKLKNTIVSFSVSSNNPKTPHILTNSGKQGEISGHLQKINSRNSCNYESGTFIAQETKLLSNNHSIHIAENDKSQENRSKSGVGQHSEVEELQRSALIKRETKTARPKWRKNKTQERLKAFNTKHRPEFKLVSEFNVKESIEKAKKISQEYKQI
jgi:hypothetical protein